ncbi:hypothetical protein [Rhodanobacter sp. A1T4]|uniref:hypothetical protein n=1 Tax=Rhodanobacter sp. A1T4 TaxID=2723087 RepID=UPI001607B989|nr:hypothetical protein [Rhodanobacter sp. A1T4]MBB6248267.1 hypothetical protein [Rhodanobacter sp. A1T4]
MPSAHSRQQRLADLRHRLTNPQDAYERCRVYPCTNGTTADRGEGLNRLYCRKHIEFYRRHGSYVKRSYGAGELRPYRAGALAWLRAHGDDQSVRLAIAGVRRLYGAAGAPVEAFRLPGKSPGERARAIWAQLRKREVDPLEVLAAWLVVDLRLRDDPQPDRHDEYRRVQVAKLIHRMAGGTHKRWERDRVDGRTEVTELHKHPVSRGRVLRIVGEDTAFACEHLRID